MLKTLFLPPALAAIYLVAINWTYMYTRPDTIAIPVFMELFAFVVWYAMTLAVYLPAILPLVFLTVALGGAGWAGIPLGLVLGLAGVVTSMFIDLDFSWPGTLGKRECIEIAVPVLICSTCSCYLVRKLWADRHPLLPVAPMRNLLISAGALVLILGLVIAWWSSKPSPRVNLAGIAEPVLVNGLAVVTEAVGDKPGGLLLGSVLPPWSWVDTGKHWERGALTQLQAFASAVDGTNYQTRAEQRGISPPATSDMNLVEAGQFLKSASLPRGTSDDVDDAINALRLYSSSNKGALAARHERHLLAFVRSSKSQFGELADRLRRDASNISSIMSPDKYSPRRVPFMVVQRLFAENDSLYELRGAAWALHALLDLSELGFSESFATPEEQARWTALRKALTEVERGRWQPVAYSVNSMLQEQQDIQLAGRQAWAIYLLMNEISN